MQGIETNLAQEVGEHTFNSIAITLLEGGAGVPSHCLQSASCEFTQVLHITACISASNLCAVQYSCLRTSQDLSLFGATAIYIFLISG